jgi:hypothetical protein
MVNNEFDILLSFVPLAFLASPALERMRHFFLWAAIAVAFLANLFLLYPRLDLPQWWVPYVTFLAVLIFDCAIKKKIQVFSVLGALFVGQALLSKDLANIAVLLLFSDAFFCAERFPHPGLEGLIISLTSLLPIGGGILLGLQGQELTYCVTASILLRLSSWPFLNLATYLDENNEKFLTCMSLISIFLLWRTQSINDPDLWAAVWMGVACVLSIGARPIELLGFVSLGLFSVSPTWGLLGMSLWSLSLYQGNNVYLITLLMAACGAFVAGETSRVLLPELAMALAALCGLFSARIFVNLNVLKTNWVIEAGGVLIAIAVGVGVFLLHPELKIAFEIPSAVFAGSFIFFFAIGKIFSRQRPRLFRPMKRFGRLGLPQQRNLGAREESMEVQRSSRVLVLPARVFNALDSEANLVLLLGVLGLLLFWRLS